jgi:DNA-binding transcriptional LysR family regulator
LNNQSVMRINYSLEELRALRALHDAKSFVQAAKSLHISQPALTRRIQLLEDALSARLVDRTTRAMTFTPLGESLVAGIAPLIDELDQQMLNAVRIAQGESGTLQFACLTTVAYAITPGVIELFHKTYPKIRVSVFDDTGQRVVESVRSGQAEFGIGLWSDELHGLNAHVVCIDPFVLAMSSNHPMAQNHQIAWAELESTPVVALRKTSENRRQIDAALELHQTQAPWFDEVEHLSSLLGWIQSGKGIGVIPRLAMRAAQAHSLRCIDLIEPQIERRIALIKRQGVTLSHTAKLAWQYFEQALKTP